MNSDEYYGQGGYGHGNLPSSSPGYGHSPNQHRSHRIRHNGGHHSYDNSDPPSSTPTTPTAPLPRDPWGLPSGHYHDQNSPSEYPTMGNYGSAMQNNMTSPMPPHGFAGSGWYQERPVPIQYQQVAVPSRHEITRHQRGHSGNGGFTTQGTRFFTPGKIFLVSWAEPAGSTATAASRNSEFVIGRDGQAIYTCPRRMVVIGTAPGQRSSTCVGVYTYNRRGLAKQGLNLSRHAVLFDEDDGPYWAPSEPYTGRELAVNTRSPVDKLDPMSRVNFGNFHTIEHNVPVREIGNISITSMARFNAYVNEAFSAYNGS